MHSTYESCGFVELYLPCHEPKWVSVGEFKIFCSGYRMFNHEQLDSLDVFIGLGDVWRNEIIYIPPHFERFVGGENKIIVVPMEDGSISRAAVDIAVRLLRCGFQVGVGCHGGHGRTGWLVGRLIREFEGLFGVPLVKEVRKRLCEKAVETTEQLFDLGVKADEIKEFFQEFSQPKAVKSIKNEKGGETIWWERFLK